MVSATALSYAVFLNVGTSTRNPPVSVRFWVGCHTSWTYAPEYSTSSGWTGSVKPGMFA